MSLLHCKPLPWRGQSVLDNSSKFGRSLEAALTHIANGQSLNSPSFESLRKEIHLELESKSGVVYHPSERLAKLDYDAFRSVFEAFCLWLGVPAPINKSGDYIKEVSDAGVRDSINAPQRGHMTNQELAFHSDRADITVLCCWATAEQGGEFRLRSSSDVITGVEKKHPHLKKLLRDPIPHDLRGEGDEPFWWMRKTHSFFDISVNSMTRLFVMVLNFLAGFNVFLIRLKMKSMKIMPMQRLYSRKALWCFSIIIRRFICGRTSKTVLLNGDVFSGVGWAVNLQGRSPKAFARYFIRWRLAIREGE